MTGRCSGDQRVAGFGAHRRHGAASITFPLGLSGTSDFSLPCKAVAVCLCVEFLLDVHLIKASFELDADERVAVRVVASVDAIANGFAEPCDKFGVAHL